MSLPANKEEARRRVRALVQSFRRNVTENTRAGSTYNETQARNDFITPLLEAFGWDVHNTAQHPLDLREVFEEATVEVGEERLSKKPDYELRLARQRKFFVEAKKPSVRIDRDKAPAFQTRRYGFSASLPISVLTNFHQLIIYDCLPVPKEEDDPHVARIGPVYSYEDFEPRFDELYDQLSRESVYSGEFDERFNVNVSRHGTQQFDEHFLKQVRSWRLRLAKDIHANKPELTPAELTFVVQLFLSRIVFLRICEDRDIEKYETLKDLGEGKTFDRLMELIKRADEFYNSGLFSLINDARLGVSISDKVLSKIIKELYYPQSPYTFSVVEAGVLGEIYEQFLGEVITIGKTGKADVVLKPEVREAGGVVPTPGFIVDAIIERALVPALKGRDPSSLSDFAVADICCGSGVFLLGAYEYLLNHHLNWYLANNRKEHVDTKIYEVARGQWRLTLEEKRRILLQFIRGVDIDPNAAEVTRFSLLLKLIEDESLTGLQAYRRAKKMRVLPPLDDTVRCGNSLVSREELLAHDEAATVELVEKINPFTWAAEFPAEMKRGGFDVIIGNPPYIRIQNMVAYSPEEVALYKGDASPYKTAKSDNFDKYGLFIERSLSLVGPAGRVGMIVPHKFITTTAGEAVRTIIADGRFLETLVHFGAQQVFGTSASNYTCILVLNKRQPREFELEQVRDLVRWRYGQPGQRAIIPSARLGKDPWEIGAGAAHAVFERMKKRWKKLGEIADIFVGVQTSADEIYIVEPTRETKSEVIVTWKGRNWPIERGILRPFLHDVTLEAYARPEHNKYIIFPYDLSGERAELYKPEVMKNDFPGTLAYLKAHKTELDKRNIVGGSETSRQFYQFGRSQSLKKFNTPKIILPILSREPRYAYDDKNIVVTGGGNGPYYLVRPKDTSEYSNFYLLAVLCHPLSEAMVRTKTSVFRGGYYSHGKQFIDVLPIPKSKNAHMKAVEALVEGIIAAMSEIKKAITPQARVVKQREVASLRGRIEALVTQAFGLSEEELQMVCAVPIPE
jgi:type I restriction-modification system DNA methylase subunit